MVFVGTGDDYNFNVFPIVGYRGSDPLHGELPPLEEGEPLGEALMRGHPISLGPLGDINHEVASPICATHEAVC